MQNFTKNGQNLFFFLKKVVKFLISRRLNQKTFYYNQYIFVHYFSSVIEYFEKFALPILYFSKNKFWNKQIHSSSSAPVPRVEQNSQSVLLLGTEQMEKLRAEKPCNVNANKCGNAAFIFEIKRFNDFIKFNSKNNLLIEKLKSSNSFPFQIIL